MKMLATLGHNDEPQKVKHYIGAPPGLTGGSDTRQQLGAASFLIIDATTDGVFLIRYQSDGNYVGDTWHMNVDDAKHQANQEFAGSLSEWRDVPSEVDDAVEFGRQQVT
jgi:hypothetical protein